MVRNGIHFNLPYYTILVCYGTKKFPITLQILLKKTLFSIWKYEIRKLLVNKNNNKQWITRSWFLKGTYIYYWWWLHMFAAIKPSCILGKKSESLHYGNFFVNVLNICIFVFLCYIFVCFIVKSCLIGDHTTYFFL